jgi:hypothetical protein
MGFRGKAYPGGVVSPSGMDLLPGVGVKFPTDQVVAFDRVGMWVNGDNICLSVWPGELQPQYKRVYSDRRKVEGLIALRDQGGWEINSNFHLGYRFAGPQQRWYPRRRLAGPAYVRQWIDDLRDGRAGGRTPHEIKDPGFRRWLVDRSYASVDELPSLDVWLDHLSPRVPLHIRPSVQVLRTWQSKDALARGREREFVVEVRDAIDRVLSALDEPGLKFLKPDARVEERSAPRTVRGSRTVASQTAAPQGSTCPACHMVHAGECL